MRFDDERREVVYPHRALPELMTARELAVYVGMLRVLLTRPGGPSG
jgi:hypothetical protein